MAKKAGTKVNKQEAAKRVAKIFPILNRLYPHARTALLHHNPFELLIATILSAQCTDARVNMVTKELFKKYRGPADWANAGTEQIEEDIRSTGFYRNKAKNIKACCEALLDRFSGQVPGTMEELTSLAGVGRKTANVILGDAFGVPSMPCDTHVIRLSRRLALSANSDPVKLEFDLMEIVPRVKWGGWTTFSHVLIYHGRNTCKARKPDCANCPISKYCPAANNPQLW